MSVPRHDHLLEQAAALVSPSGGTIRQVDLRRAISTAYYAVFHLVSTAVADEFVGSTMRATQRYALVYRRVEHRALKDLCLEVRKPTPSRRYAAYVPTDGYGPDILIFARGVVALQERRHLADYDPRPRFTPSSARLAIATARSAVANFDRVDRETKRTFLTLLAFPPR